MKLADLFNLEPAPIHNQFVRRVVFDPKTPLELPPKLDEDELRRRRRQKDADYRAKHRERLNAQKAAYKRRKRAGLLELTMEDLANVGTVSHR